MSLSNNGTDAARTLGFTSAEKRKLDSHVIDDLLAGRALDEDVRSGASLHEAAFDAGYADAAARTLVDRYREFVKQRNQRDQIALF